jgi:hypothetical protein
MSIDSKPPQISDAELTAWAELAEKATPGPWEAQEPAFCPNFGKAKIKPLKIEGKIMGFAVIKQFDAAFIAAARQAVPRLIEALRAAQAELEHMRANIMDTSHDAQIAQAVENASLREQNTRYREALEWYADEENYDAHWLDNYEGIPIRHLFLKGDGGAKARAALQEEKE